MPERRLREHVGWVSSWLTLPNGHSTYLVSRRPRRRRSDLHTYAISTAAHSLTSKSSRQDVRRIAVGCRRHELPTQDETVVCCLCAAMSMDYSNGRSKVASGETERKHCRWRVGACEVPTVYPFYLRLSASLCFTLL